MKEIFKKINESKEEIKFKISKIFTKIRNIVNEREDQLLKELDNLYDNSIFKEDLIKKGEKMPNIIKMLLDKGNLIINEWNDNNKLIERTNDCINFEEKIKNIIEINENIKKCNIKKLNLEFLPEIEQSNDLLKNLEKFFMKKIINLNLKFS